MDPTFDGYDNKIIEEKTERYDFKLKSLSQEDMWNLFGYVAMCRHALDGIEKIIKSGEEPSKKYCKADFIKNY